MNRAGTASEDRSLARRNAAILAASQAIVGSAAPISVSIGALAGSSLLGDDKSLATLPVTGFTAGVAIGAVFAAALTRLVGRRYGFMAGASLPAVGGIVAALALYDRNFWLLALGLMIVGFGNSFVQQYRFAAADAAPPAFKPQAISIVLVGGIFAAIIGPQTVIHTQAFFAPVMFAGSFVALVPLALLGMVLLSFLHVPEHATLIDDKPEAPARPLGAVLTQFRFVTALVCAIGSYGFMSFMMTGAPLAIVADGHSADLATLGIQWHVLAMYAPSFFTGRLIANFGRERIVALGFVVMLACGIIAHLGTSIWHFWAALALLGLGWNFGFIGATAMATSCYRPSEKNAVQGVHDVILFTCVALSSFASGQVLNAFGWDGINLVAIPVAAICLALLALDTFTARRTAA
ncbi:MFS transporter [Pararhizobium mangrovi]|uniref:MFS transporter n=1 Tax=Pararhizobium mangrovi TaxID=2590452 RepID=A0A506UD62_9HYPH|nr:MFS transporter [Pararhizobium mangrovi]TPW31870.1 MFS transporter [Pararhizobium mangrovi]